MVVSPSMSDIQAAVLHVLWVPRQSMCIAVSLIRTVELQQQQQRPHTGTFVGGLLLLRLTVCLLLFRLYPLLLVMSRPLVVSSSHWKYQAVRKQYWG